MDLRLRQQMHKIKNRFKSYRINFLFYKKWYKRDVLNRIKHGANSPLSCERIFIDPGQVRWVIDPYIFYREDSGCIVGGDWDLNKSNFHDSPKYRICHERFVNGKTWEEAGAYELWMSRIKKKPDTDGCRSIDDLIKRYDELDNIYRQIKNQNRLLSRQEINPRSFREYNGVLVHVDRNGDIIFGDEGCHRLAISMILQLKVIPVQIGVVHEVALPFWREYITKASN